MERYPTVEVMGLRWRLVLDVIWEDNPGLATRLIALWERARVEPGGGEREFVVVRGDQQVPQDENGTACGVRLQDADAFPYAFSRAMTLASISARRGTALSLHAAGLTLGKETAVLVGSSGSGKSTAVRTLGRSFGYLSDETVTIEPDLRVSPYPKPISLKSPERSWDKDEHSPEELGLRRCDDDPRVGALVLLRRADDVTEPTMTPIGLIDGMLAVLPESSGIHRLEQPLHWLARAMISNGGPYELSYREITSCAGLVERVLHGADPETNPVKWVGHPPSDCSASVAAGEVAQVRRAPWTDAIECDGEVLVLLDRRPCRLSGVGALVWLTAAEPTTVDRLVDQAIAEFGSHPSALEVVEAVLVDMAEIGLLAI